MVKIVNDRYSHLVKSTRGVENGKSLCPHSVQSTDDDDDDDDDTNLQHLGSIVIELATKKKYPCCIYLCAFRCIIKRLQPKYLII